MTSTGACSRNRAAVLSVARDYRKETVMSLALTDAIIVLVGIMGELQLNRLGHHLLWTKPQDVMKTEDMECKYRRSQQYQARKCIGNEDLRRLTMH